MFNFQDFVLYTGADSSNEFKYATIAAGVLSYVEDTYGIYLEETTKDFSIFSEDASTLILGLTPIVSINTVKQLNSDVAYTYYGREVTLTGTFDSNIPVDVNITLGYTTVPADLKMAIYTHIESVFYHTQNHLSNVSKTVNSEGNSTFYRELSVPLESVFIYDKYSKRQLVLA